MIDDEDQLEPERGDRSFGFATAVLVLVAAALVAFVLQNTQEQRVEWLFWDITVALWLLLVITAALGAVLANLGWWLLRRRRGR